MVGSKWCRRAGLKGDAEDGKSHRPSQARMAFLRILVGSIQEAWRVRISKFRSAYYTVQRRP
jgi:hypothetical protein